MLALTTLLLLITMFYTYHKYMTLFHVLTVLACSKSVRDYRDTFQEPIQPHTLLVFLQGKMGFAVCV